MPETLFIIGREPELSVAELEAVVPGWGAEVIDVQPAGVLLRTNETLPPDTIDRLGGSLKQVEVLECFDLKKKLSDVLPEFCTPTWLGDLFAGRVEFGVSGYGLTAKERGELHHYFLGLKKEIHDAGRPVRLVVSREPQLSTVTVQRNGLVKKGKEFVFFRTSQKLVLGVTVSVQDYRAYSRRDYGRPAANAKNGMVPPKLAQMMLNIAQVKPDDVLLDPFCGTGTILQEAALFGVGQIHGSDSEGRAVKDSQQNMRWLLSDFAQIKTDVEIVQRDVREGRIRPTVIVTEPYLGQPLRGHEPLIWLNKQKAELEKLYLQTFQHWQKQLPVGARVVMIWPEFVDHPATSGPAGAGPGGRPALLRRGTDSSISLQLDSVVAGLGFELQALVSPTAAAVLKIKNPTVLSYGRDDARVRRQIRKWVKG